MNAPINPHRLQTFLAKQQSRQQQELGNVQVQGDENIFNAIQAKNITLTQNKIIQISADEIKTRKFIKTSPYKGLKSFKVEDKEQFFGRDQFIAGLVNELEQTNFVLLLGASGSGKSSVVRAGLMPWLSRKWGMQWVNLTLTPDRDPFDSLYSSLRPHFKQSEVQFVREGTDTTLDCLVKTLKQPDSFWFIFIDQLEELFTLSEPETRDRFITSLAKLCKDHANDPTLKIVATMRADFLNRLDGNPANLLVKATKGHRPLITQMHPDELRLAIEQPAAHHGVVFEAGLVKTIIEDVQGQAGYLSLLQHTLDMLWKVELQDNGLRDRTLTAKSYYRIGGVRGAIQQRVDQIYQGLSPSEQLAAQHIFLRLVGIGGDTTSETTWKPVRKREARSHFNDASEQSVLSKLIDANLLISDTTVGGNESESTVEITHEILLTSWPQLNEWIRENREAIALRNRLNDDVIQWKTTQSEDELWSGSKLKKAIALQKSPAFNQVLGGFSLDAIAFIEASIGLRKHTGQRKRIQRQWPLTQTNKARNTSSPNTSWVKVVGAVMAGLAVFSGVLIKQYLNSTQLNPEGVAPESVITIGSASNDTSNIDSDIPINSEDNGSVDTGSDSSVDSDGDTGSNDSVDNGTNENVDIESNSNVATRTSGSADTQSSGGVGTQSNGHVSTQANSSVDTQASNGIGSQANGNAGTVSNDNFAGENDLSINNNTSSPNETRPEEEKSAGNSNETRTEEEKSTDNSNETRPENQNNTKQIDNNDDGEESLLSHLTIHHTRQGASSGHTDTIVAYKTWGGGNWIASMDATGTFIHTAQGARSSHTDKIINYTMWDGAEWTATIDPVNKIFTHTRRGATTSHTAPILSYLTWDGSAWTMRLE